MLHCAPQCICRTDLHVLWNMQLQSRTVQGPKQYGWVKSRWLREGGPAPSCTVHTLVLPGTQYTASNQSLQWPVQQVHSSITGFDKTWLEKMCVVLGHSVLMGVTQTNTGSLLRQRYLENSVCGSLFEISLNTSYKARVEPVLQWATCGIWLADRRRAQNCNRETSLDVDYWHIDCLHLNQHLMHLLYMWSGT
jgi:hypothetical protein